MGDFLIEKRMTGNTRYRVTRLLRKCVLQVEVEAVYECRHTLSESPTFFFWRDALPHEMTEKQNELRYIYKTCQPDVSKLVEALKYYREEEWLGGEDGVAAKALAEWEKLSG